MNIWLLAAAFVLTAASEASKKGDDEDWVNLPNKCEEMKSAFEETGKTKEVIDRNYRFLDEKGAPPIKYVKSDIRFIEVMETVCQRLQQYNVHKERPGSNRFAKGMSETFSTLHNLVHKGVKVVMDIPYELWNETSAEVSDLKKQCDVMVEQYEDVIEDWYRGLQEEDLTSYLCEKHVLRGQDAACLSETWGRKKSINEEPKKKKIAKKSKEGARGGQASQSKPRKKSKKRSAQPSEAGGRSQSDEGLVLDDDVPKKATLRGEKTEL